MDAFGVQFSVYDPARFETLSRLLCEVKHDKDENTFRSADAWRVLIPDDLQVAFDWLTDEDFAAWSSVRDTVPVSVPEPHQQIGERWHFNRVFESIEDGDYDILGCVMVADTIVEIQIDPHGYPYGGVGPFIALVEAFGFQVLGVNECGRFESREELLSHV